MPDGFARVVLGPFVPRLPTPESKLPPPTIAELTLERNREAFALTARSIRSRGFRCHDAGATPGGDTRFTWRSGVSGAWTVTDHPDYVYSLVVKAMLCSGEYGEEWSWGIEHRCAIRTDTLAHTMHMLGRVVPLAEAERCQRIDFILVVYRRLAKHGGRGKRVDERALATVRPTDPDDVLDRCFAIMPWQAFSP